MKFVYVLVLLFLVNISFCQDEYNTKMQLAIIADTDGYSFVRERKEMNSQVIDTIYENEFFYASQDFANDWWKVIYNGKEGYMHKSRVRFLELMDNLTLRTLINDIFIAQKELLYQMKQVKYGEKQYVCVSKFLNRYYDNRYKLILELGSNLIIEHKDIELLSSFIDVVSLSTGSADELQSSVLSKVLYYLPEETIVLVSLKNSKYLNKYLINSFKFYKTEANIDNNKYERIMSKLMDSFQ